MQAFDCDAAPAVLFVLESPELFLQIIRTLSNIERIRILGVCAHWDRLIFVSGLRFDSNSGPRVTASGLALICKRAAGSLRTLDVSTCSGLTMLDVVEALMQCPPGESRLSELVARLRSWPRLKTPRAEDAPRLQAACPRLARAECHFQARGVEEAIRAVWALPGPLSIEIDLQVPPDEVVTAEMFAALLSCPSLAHLYVPDSFFNIPASAPTREPSAAEARAACAAAATIGAALARSSLQSLDLLAHIEEYNPWDESWLCWMGGVAGAALAAALGPGCTAPLRKLCLFGNRVGDAGAAALASVLVSGPAQLTDLDLGHCSFGPDGLAALAHALAQNPGLKALLLAYNEIDCGGAAVLARALHSNDTLETLDLSCCNCVNAGAAALAQALLRNRGLTSLNLDSNQEIGPEGTRALAGALAQNSTLCELVLSETDVGDEGAMALAKALSSWGGAAPPGLSVLCLSPAAPSAPPAAWPSPAPWLRTRLSQIST